MIAHAPGKLLLSGAYAVLEGAPAIVTAVNRRASADSSQQATFLTDEVRSAIDLGFLSEAPQFDASPLRTTVGGVSRKLGLGSSAAILVASMGAAWPRQDPSSLRDELFHKALKAHRQAQGGGSGVDVAASVYGGFLRCQLDGTGHLQVEAITLPEPLSIHVFAFDRSASTPELLKRVRKFRDEQPSQHRSLMRRLADASERAAKAAHVESLLRALADQLDCLDDLGQASSAPIVLPELRELARLAERESAVVGTAGAGGGDVAVLLSAQPPSPALMQAAIGLGLTPTDLEPGAPGVTREPS